MNNYKKASNVNICYIGGGSRGWAWKLMSDLYLEKDLSGTVILYDIDHQAAEINKKIGNEITATGTEENGKWEYKKVNSLEEGLTGADFVIISILPNTFEEMRNEVHTPEKYGIYQSVGDSTGPGGLFRALRIFPMYKEIAEAIRDNSPDAWVINYTNPMALCTGMLYQVFPEIKAFGCCHEVFGTQKILLDVLKEEGIYETNLHNLNTNVVGINHFTWITQATYKDIDLIPLYKKYVEKHVEGVFGEPENIFAGSNLVKFDLFKRYGAIAAAGDRHLAEFAPEYLGTDEDCKKWGYRLTPVSWRIENRERLIALSKKYEKMESTMPIEESGEDGVRQIKALLGLGDLVTNVNLPNIGQMDVDYSGIVETNALFSYESVRPVVSGTAPEGVMLRMKTHMNNQQAILDAIMTDDINLAYYAFANDPLTKSLSPEQAKQLFIEMFENNSKYLSRFSLELLK